MYFVCLITFISHSFFSPQQNLDRHILFYPYLVSILHRVQCLTSYLTLLVFRPKISNQVILQYFLFLKHIEHRYTITNLIWINHITLKSVNNTRPIYINNTIQLSVHMYQDNNKKNSSVIFHWIFCILYSSMNAIWILISKMYIGKTYLCDIKLFFCGSLT